MTDIRKYVHKHRNDVHACNCIGPQNGQPVCPCQMRGVTVENGRYVQKRDLGPIEKAYTEFLDSYGSK